jgi:ubiquinone/menaquinone biosynthesis C-methylase UbiE
MGCGEGVLVRELVRVVPFVVGLDRDRPSLQSAQSHGAVGSSFVAGDMLASPFPSATFDMVTSVASLHHVDAVAGLEEMARLLAPGGVLVVIGLARGRYPTDLPIEIAAFAATRVHRWRKGQWETTAPKMWHPAMTFAGMRKAAAKALPGVHYRRHLLWRYSLVWVKPLAGQTCKPPLDR